MAPANAPTSSLTAHTTPIEVGGHVVAACFTGQAALFAVADGSVVIASGDRATRRVEAHPDAGILVAAHDGKRLLTGGDDGRVVAADASGAAEEMAKVSGWVDALAGRADGAVAWSSGREVFARDPKGAVKSWTAPSTVRGLAFMPKGYRLAVAHYNACSLWFPNMATAPEALEWKGSHLDVTVSPDGRFVITSMQENSLHGWRLADKRDMRMSGYPAKTRSFSWSADGQWLATSGADACVVWPFATKDGPMGRAPKEVGVRQARATCVAFHPRAPVLAVGYADGFVLLARIEDGAEILVRNAGEGGAVGALGWDGAGKSLLFGTEGGRAGRVDLPS